jgi:hypothetical protein
MKAATSAADRLALRTSAGASIPSCTVKKVKGKKT